MTETDATVKLMECVNFAAVKHRNQRRKDSDATPYINHPIGNKITSFKYTGAYWLYNAGVARILSYEAGITDLVVLQAALLHDTVEDTDTSFEEIEEKFGKIVADIVREVTDDKSLPSQERKRLQIVHAPASSHQAKLVKLADKLYNLRDLTRAVPRGWTSRRREEYFEWAKKVVDGLRGTNQTIEQELDKIFSECGLL